MKGRSKQGAGRPAKPPNQLKRHAIVMKLDDAELALVEQAAEKDHDRRANWAKRKVLMAAERRLGLSQTNGGSSPTSKS